MIGLAAQELQATRKANAGVVLVILSAVCVVFSIFVYLFFGSVFAFCRTTSNTSTAPWTEDRDSNLAMWMINKRG